jgi:hypothetical protein
MSGSRRYAPISVERGRPRAGTAPSGLRLAVPQTAVCVRACAWVLCCCCCAARRTRRSERAAAAAAAAARCVPWAAHRCLRPAASAVSICLSRRRGAPAGSDEGAALPAPAASPRLLRWLRAHRRCPSLRPAAAAASGPPHLISPCLSPHRLLVAPVSRGWTSSEDGAAVCSAAARVPGPSAPCLARAYPPSAPAHPHASPLLPAPAPDPDVDSTSLDPSQARASPAHAQTPPRRRHTAAIVAAHP